MRDEKIFTSYVLDKYIAFDNNTIRLTLNETINSCNKFFSKNEKYNIDKNNKPELKEKENFPIELVIRITKTNIKKFIFLNCFLSPKKISEKTKADPAT